MNAPLTLFDKVGLLAGQPVTATVSLAQPDQNGRTCIDGGQSALVTLGTRGIIGYATPARSADGLQFWRRGCFGSPTKGQCVMVTSQTSTARATAAQLAPPRIERARKHMQTLAAYGQVYMSTALEPETGQSWQSFMLHPRQSLRPVLSALDVCAAWPALREAFSRALTRPIGDNLRPWSVAIEASSGRIRIGTTAWARIPETQNKSAALHDVLSAFGPDPTTASAIYSLAQRSAAASTRPRRAGVAAEFDLQGTHISSATFTVRLNK